MNSSRFSVVSGDRYLFVMRFSCAFASGSAPLNVYLEYNTPVGDPSVDRVYFMRKASVSADDCTLTVDFEAKELTAGETIAAIGSSDLGPFVHKLDEAKQIINHFTPEFNEE